MATLEERALEIKNETKKGANTAERVGSFLVDMLKEIKGGLAWIDERLSIVEDRGIRLAILTSAFIGRDYTKEELETMLGVTLPVFFANIETFLLIRKNSGPDDFFYPIRTRGRREEDNQVVFVYQDCEVVISLVPLEDNCYGRVRPLSVVANEE